MTNTKKIQALRTVSSLNGSVSYDYGQEVSNFIDACKQFPMGTNVGDIIREGREIIEIVVPEWATERDLSGDKLYADLANIIELLPDASERWVRRLACTDHAEVICALISDANTTGIRASLRDQALAWLNAEERKYNSPFSIKQWRVLNVHIRVATSRDYREFYANNW